ncbi:MAG TPA: ATP-binding protein [Streptosporangiaceae bacterium]|nr:ATP-binding protein [Streptosporangiaceae bacterium]
MVYLEARDDLVATAAYQPVPAAAAAARRFIRDTLQSWELTGRSREQDGLVDDAVLLTSELVTNAVLHAGTPVQVTCRVVGDERDGAVEIAVLDRRPGQLRPDLPHSPADAAERTNGRGLQLPAQLASAWGVTYAGTAKAVWFRMSLTGPGGAGGCYAAEASVPAPPSFAAVPAWNLSGPEPAIVRPRREPDPSLFEHLLASTVETARDAIGADTAYLLHACDESEPRVRAAAADSGEQPARAGPALPVSAAKAVAAGALSLVTVPLMVEGRVTGVLAAAAAEPGRFSESDASRLQDLANRSAPVLERARLSSPGPT